MSGRLHERERQLTLIADSLDEAVDGRGGALLVRGPAGIGKSSLLEVARAEAHARAFAVAGARGSDLESAYAWGVVRQLFEPRLRGMSADARGTVLAGAAALAGPVVLPDAADPALDADESFGVLHGLYWLVAGLAAQRPQLLVVDDLHWADGASARFLEFLTNRLDSLPVLLLVAQRPGIAAADGLLGASQLVSSLELAPLSLAATAAVLAEPGDASVDAAFAEACHDATGGNPLLLRRLAEGLRERGVRDAEAVRRLGPYAVAGPVAATLARLGDGPARLAAAVAVLERAPLLTAARLAGLDSREASTFGEQLVRAGILRDARPLEFQHALVREAVVSGLTAGERARLHAEAAALLAFSGASADAVVVHLLLVEPGGDATTVAVLAEAGRRALRSGAPDAAAAYLARALAEPPAAVERSQLLLELARAEHGLGRPEALDHVLDAHAAATDELERARAALALGWASGPGQQDPEAVGIVERAIAELAGRDPELELQLEALRYAAIAFIGDAALMRRTLGEAERFAELEGRTVGECVVLPHVAIQRFFGGRSAAECAAPVERAVADARIVASIGPDSTWLMSVLAALFKADRLELARRTADISIVEAQRRGSAPGFAVASVWRAWIALREGSAIDAEADARAAFESLPRGLWQQQFAAGCLIEVLVERSALDEAQALVESGRTNLEPVPARSAEMFLYVDSILRASRGDHRGALAAQLESRRLRGGELGPDSSFDAWVEIARLHHAAGDRTAAEREAAAALDWARVWGTPGSIGQALTVTGRIRGGDEGLAELRESVEQLEQSPARRELARSLIELGAALRRRGERVAAREPLRRALDIASAGGLEAIGERAREELRVTGARIRRPAASGIASLTPSERRIVDLAAGGASNPEIAQALFVTVKTVEMHLGNAYRKLDIRSRHELERALAPD